VKVRVNIHKRGGEERRIIPDGTYFFM